MTVNEVSYVGTFLAFVNEDRWGKAWDVLEAMKESSVNRGFNVTASTFSVAAAHAVALRGKYEEVVRLLDFMKAMGIEIDRNICIKV
eukprot:CAMPEP_0204872876 /NCGR_PEP_ID=MMETSP1348-20121228/39161_1 /ASSEMBLY_ACC=CAM_ASM_000700 /TAXON_ID=215587 /ORGANISM="Aplanochytrium stocchinoi, Strain GSBS06" /LENGTH=86 /DNA_ID=CAMNT_0052027949 /DNA_START=12 /DNA_END=268 /DNA_ORIENTATION=+